MTGVEGFEFLSFFWLCIVHDFAGDIESWTVRGFFSGWSTSYVQSFLWRWSKYPRFLGDGSSDAFQQGYALKRIKKENGKVCWAEGSCIFGLKSSWSSHLFSPEQVNFFSEVWQEEPIQLENQSPYDYCPDSLFPTTGCLNSIKQH